MYPFRDCLTPVWTSTRSYEGFYKNNGSHINCFAENQEATTYWCDKIVSSQIKTQHGIQRRESLLASDVCQTLLETKRIMRPTAAQVFDKLKDMDLIYNAGPDCWIDDCCVRQSPYTPEVAQYKGSHSQADVPGRDPYFAYDLPQWPLLDLTGLDDHLAYLLLDIEFAILSHSNNLSYLTPAGKPANLGCLFVSVDGVTVLQKDVQAMLRLINLPRRINGSVNYNDTDYAVMLKSLQLSRI